MKKQLHVLAFFAALLLPWTTNAQVTLADYTFSTGVDATKWITLTSPTNIFSTDVDDEASSVYNIGFTFPFGMDSYTQFSVSSNGIFKLGASAASSSTQAGMFNSSYYTTSLPKICGVAKDIGTAGTGYVRYQLTGTAPNRVLVCEYLMGYTYSASTSDVKWQVQLHESTSEVTIVYGPTAPATTPSSFHTGLATASNDIVILNPSTHAPIYLTTYQDATYSTWHGVNRYYTFLPPNLTCPRPTNLSVSNLTATSATLSWQAGGTETSWIVSDGTTETVVTTPTYTFTGLTPATDYSLTVRGICSSTDTSAASRYAVSTPCVAATVPFTEGFESVTGTTSTSSSTNYLPNCWGYINRGTRTNYLGCPYVYSGSSYAHGGTKSVKYYVYYSTGTSVDSSQYLILPVTDGTTDPINTLRLKYWMRGYNTGTSYIAQCVVGVITDASNPRTFIPFDTVTSTGSTTYAQYTVSFANYTGPHGRVAMLFPKPLTSSPGYNTGYVDDITLEKLPTCPGVEQLAISNTTPTTAQVNWVANATASSWEVRYYPTATPAAADTLVVTSYPVTLTNLAVGTAYTLKVTPVCTIGDSSTETATVTFRTECAYLDTSDMPYTMGFETADGVTGTGSSTSATFAVNCWHHINNATQYFGYPYVYGSAYHTGSRGIYWYGSTTVGTYGDYQVVVLPGVDVTQLPVNTLQLRFWAKVTDASYHPTFIVGVMSDPEDLNTFTPVQTVNINTTQPYSMNWAEYLVNLESYMGTGCHVAIRANRPTSAWYAYMDDITLEPISDCPRVERLHATNVTTTSANIRWSDAGYAPSYGVIYYSTSANRDTLTVYDTVAALANLNPGTTYTVIVTPECTGTTVARQMTFTTECAYLDTLPYTMGFETADGVTSTGTSTSTYWVPCWHRLNTGTQYFGYPYVASSTSYAHTGSRGLYWYNNNTTATTYGAYQVVVLRGVETSLLPMNTLQLKFWAKSSNASYYPVFQVGVMTDPEDISTFQQVGTVHVDNSTEWDEYSVAFTGYTGSGNYVALRADRTTGSWYAYLDDFTLDLSPQCPPITHLTVTEVTNTSVTATWDYPTDLLGTPQLFEAECYPVGDTTNVFTSTSTTSRILFTGLDTNTTYVLRLRADCDSYGYGEWSSITFTTNSLQCLLDPTSVDTVNFSNSTSGTSGCIAYSSYGNTVYQTIYTVAELTAAGLSAGNIIGIDLGFTGSSYAKEFTIFIGTTTTTSISNATIENPNLQQQVYGPAPHPANTSGWQHYDFNAPFVWDGRSNIIITTFMNQPSGTSQTSSSGLTGYYVSASNKARYRYQDSSPYTLTAYNSGNAGSTYSYRASIHFYTGTCNGLATCVAPTVYVTRVAADEIDIEWAAGFQETSWDVEYRMAGTTTWQAASTSETNNSYTFTNLTPNTSYDIRVSHSCDGNTYAAIVHVTTPCVPVATLPWHETFESATTGSSTSRQFVSCMGRLNNGTTYFGYPYVSSTTDYNHTASGSKGLYWYNTTTTGTYGDYQVVTLPAVDTDVMAMNTLQLRFWAKATGASYYPVFIVGVMSDTANINTFEEVDTVYVNNSMVWEDFIVRLDTYTGTGTHIAIRANRPTTAWYAAVDDITIEELEVCPRVDSLTLSNVSAHSVDLDWVERGTATEWVVRYYPTATPAQADSVTAYSTPFTLTGLNMQTDYTVEVHPECYGDNTSSRVCTFTTPCEAIVSFPYTENFDALTTSTSSATGIHVPCWQHIMTGTSSYQTVSYQPQVYYSSTYAHSGNYSLRLYGVGYTMLPPMGISLDSLQMTFWDYTTGSTYGLEVGVMEGNTFVPIQSFTPSSSTHVEYLVDFSRYTGTSRIIAFRNYYVNSTGTYYSYHYIDNVTVEIRPVCPRVESMTAANITSSSADISWTDTANASSYQVYYYPTQYPASIDSDYVYTNSVSLNNLDPMTNYTVIVKPDCNGEYAGTNQMTFNTACGYITLPFVEDFETRATTTNTTSNSSFINCWHHFNNGTSYMGYPYIASSTSYNHTAGGTKGLYWYGTTTTGSYGDYYYIVLPAVDTFTSPMNTLRVKFWAMPNSTSYHPAVRVGVMSDPTNVNSFRLVKTVNVNPGSSTAWAQYEAALDTFTGSGEYLAIGAVRPTSAWTMYMDDITVEQIPNCPEVTAVTATGVTTNSAILNWTEVGTATFWDIEYGPVGFRRGTGTTETVTTLPHTISGLNANTEYTVYISPDCQGVRPLTSYNFRTECDVLDLLPYTYGFEGMDAGSNTIRPVINCWHHLNNGTQYFGYPYVYSSAYHTGTRGLYWYGSTTTGTYGDYQMVVLPGVDATLYPINTLQLKFWAKSTGTSYYPIFQVGVMTDPNDVTTFRQVNTVNVDNSTQWAEYTAGLADYTGSGQYIALRANRPSSMWYAYTDDFTLEVAPLCPQVVNVNAPNVGTTGAQLTWSVLSGFASTPTEYEIEITPSDHTEHFSNVTVYSSGYLLSGLMPGHTYNIRVRSNCDADGYGAWSPSYEFTTLRLPCLQADPTSTVSIPIVGTPTSTNYTIPVNNFYNYTVSQQLVLASELAGATHIRGIEFQYNYSSAMTSKTNCTIYMANVTNASLSSFIPYNASTFTRVYTGNLNCSSSNGGWTSFNFTTPFQYDGTSNLLIMVMDNSGSYNGNSYVFTTHSVSGRTVYAYTDSSPYTLTSLPSATTASYRSNMKLHVDGCAQYASCGTPLVLVDSVAADEVDLVWAAGSEETSWEVEYRAQSDTGWTSEGVVSTTDYAFTNLTPATAYQFRVTAQCSDTDLATIVRVTTPCVPMAVPFTENFETFSTTVADPLPTCWEKHTNYSSNYPYASTSYNHSASGNRSMYMYSTNTTYTYMVLPQFDLPIDSTLVTFWLYASNTAYALNVGVMTDPSDVSTFVSVATATPTATNTWQPFEIPLNAYTGNGRFIAIMSPNGITSYPYLDDLVVDRIPACPRVYNVLARDITSRTATVEWDTTSATEYEVQYGGNGFTLGTGHSLTVSNADTAVLTGLHASNGYDVYVRGICGADTGNWSFVHSFRTPCGALDTLPLTENFESVATGSSTGTSFVPCWGHLNNGSTYYGYPYVGSNSAYSHNGGTRGLYWYASTTTGSYGDYQIVVLPPVDTTIYPINTLQLTFWARATSTGYNPQFIVGVMTDATSATSFHGVDTINIMGNTEWQFFEIPLVWYTGYGDRVAIRANRPTSLWYAYMDEITLEVAPTCLHVADVHQTSMGLTDATVAWTLRDPLQNTFEVRYGPEGSDPDTLSPMYVYGDSVALTGLDSGMLYEAFVRPICTPGDTGTYVSGYFRTVASSPVTSYPYTCDFTGMDGRGWNRVNGNERNRWYLDTAAFSGTADSMALYISADTGHTNSYNITATSTVYAYRTFNLPAGEYGYSFDWRCQGEAYMDDDEAYDYLRAMLIPDSVPLTAGVLPMNYLESYDFAYDTLPAGWVDLISRTTTPYVLASQGDWSTQSGVFRIAQQGLYNLVFMWTNDPGAGTNPPAAIDNVLVMQNLCPSVTDLTVSNILTDSAMLIWSGSSDNTGFIVEYDTVNFMSGYGANQVTINDTSYILSGLDSGRTYYVSVKALCSSSSSIGIATRFTTLAASPARVPYHCDFERTGTNGWDLYNGSQTNAWYVGNAAHNGAGSRALYISSDNGTTNTYNNSALSNVFATRTFLLSDTGEYAYSYDWRANGESCCDYMRVALVPASVQVSPDNYSAWTMSTGTPVTGATADLSSNNRLNMQTSWQTVNGTFRLTTPGTYKWVFFWHNDGSLGTDTPAAVDNLALIHNTCPVVRNLSANCFGDSIQLSWTAGSSEYEWLVEWDTNMSQTVYSPNFTITGLTPLTNYTVSVVAVCGADDSSMRVTNTYTTTCALAAIPYTQNFDALTTGTATSNLTVVPPCWDYVLTNSSYSSATYYPGVYYSSSYAHSGNYSYRLYGVGYHMLPPMSAPLDSLMLTFWNYTTGTTYGLEVGVMEGNTFVPIRTVTTPSSTQVEHTVYLNTYTGSSRIIAFRNFYINSTTGYSYNYIDNVTVNYIPSCLPVDSLEVNTFSDSIQLSWVPRGTETEWLVTWGNMSQSVYSPNYTIPYLTSNTNYAVTVRAVCGAGDTSTAVGGTYHTLCDPVALPYTQNFDGITTSTSSATGAHVPCWDYIMTGTGSYATGSYLPQVYYGSTYAHSGNYSYRLYGNGYHMLPPMPTSLDSLQLTFWNYTTGTTYGLEVGVMEGTTFVPIQVVTPASSSTHVQTTVYFGSYTGSSRIIAFHNFYTTSTSTYYSYHYLDNVEVDYLASCPPVSGLTSTGNTSTTVTLNWTENGHATQWEVAQGSSSTATPTSGTVVNSRPTTVTGLTGGTTYYFWVRPICGAGDTGRWFGPLAVVPGSWNMRANQTDTLRMCGGVLYDDGGPNAAYSNSQTSMVILMPSSAGGLVRVQGTYTGEGCCDYFSVYDGIGTSGTQLIRTTSSSTGTPVTIGPFTSTTGPLTISFTSDGSVTSDGFVLNVTCSGPTCPQPTVTITSTTSSTVTASWTGTSTNYEAAIKPASASSWPTATQVVGNIYTFSGLQPATAYQVRVRQICDSVGSSEWATANVTTDSLGCQSPDSLTFLSATNRTASFSWRPAGSETAWQMHVFNTTIDSIYAPVTTTTATVDGLTTGTSYYAAVRSICRAGDTSAWGDTVTFTTQTCPTVTGVTPSNVTFNSVTLNWTAIQTAQSYEVEYGMTGFTQGNGTTLTTTTNSITINGLYDESSYSFYVRAVCGTNWTSENWSSPVTITTGTISGTTYTVTLTVNNPLWGRVIGDGQYSENSQVTISAIANTGYHFTQWSDNDTHAVRTFTLTANVSLMASFAPNQYTITVSSTDSTMGTASVSGTGVFNYNTQATLTATPAVGHHFVQWNDGVTFNPRTITVTSDSSFTATFAADQYTVTATANDPTMGTVTGGGTYYYGDMATLQAIPNSGFYFHGWNDGNMDNPRVFTVIGDVSYTAMFSNDSNVVQTYTVTLNVNDPAMGQVHGSGTYAEGSDVEISATPNTGYRFVNWSDNVTTNPRTLHITSDVTLTAMFSTAVDSSALLVVDYNSEMGYVEINGRETNTYNGRLGDEVRVKALAYEGYRFVDWSDGVTAAERTVTLRQNRTDISANFADNNGILTVNGDISCLIYPNPATSSTTISVSGANGKVRIAVVDINGRVVATETLECAGDCVKTMNVENLSQGAYFVRITGEQVNLVKKLIVR